jgi:hypothetical protein
MVKITYVTLFLGSENFGAYGACMKACACERRLSTERFHFDL